MKDLAHLFRRFKIKLIVWKSESFVFYIDVVIINIDPIKYNLLFERFLNPDRKSMPDIDTDFDDEGRQKVIDYVVEKYGKNQVAQIITYGTMA